MADSGVSCDFAAKNVAFLQDFLRKRGVSVNQRRKDELVMLCEQADRLGVELDPDGLLENRSQTVTEKLCVDDGTQLTLPTLMDASHNFSDVPTLTAFDMYHYLSKGHSSSVLRNFHNMEGYHLQRDGYVLDLQCVTYPSPHSALLAKVKPRTNAKDPVTGLSYYVTWVLLSSADKDERILSAFCCCRGGIDGFCRHVTAVIIEYTNFRNDNTKSCTSELCVWSVPSCRKEPTEPLEVVNLDTSMYNEGNKPQPHLREVLSEKRPNSAAFFEGIKACLPAACILDTQYAKEGALSVPPLEVQTPQEKLEHFKKTHVCKDSQCECSHDFLGNLYYSEAQRQHVEKATMGQASNSNWFAMRKNILTASKFKTVCHSLNLGNTAAQLMKDSFMSDYIPAPIAYGRKNEEKARNMFMRTHEMKHKKCHLEEKGVCFSAEVPYLACSPDGIVHCKQCGTFLIEIKCLWKYRNFHPRIAGKMSELIKEQDNGSFIIDEKHSYHYQIQGQMAITGIKKAFLIIFTDKGIYPVNVPFNNTMWDQISEKLKTFYHKFYFPALVNALDS